MIAHLQLAGYLYLLTSSSKIASTHINAGVLGRLVTTTHPLMTLDVLG